MRERERQKKGGQITAETKNTIAYTHTHTHSGMYYCVSMGKVM